MVDWLSSMQQTFEFYRVDPATWTDSYMLRNVINCRISRSSEDSTLGHATIDCLDETDECYIRVYLVTNQNGITEKRPLGTFIVQSPSVSFDGKVESVSMDAYTPLLELKDNSPPLGYTITKGTNIMEAATRLCKENSRAPIVGASSDTTLHDDFIANPDDTWLSFITDLIANAKFIFDIDEMGRILFAPKQDTASLQPVWTYDDSNSSILYPDISVDRDLYGIPNVVEVLYSSSDEYLYSKVVNDDESSPISTVNRGREILYRDTNPSLPGNPTQEQIDEYAEQLLRELSCLKHTISYSHGYSTARVGDCVRLNYRRAGLYDIKAKVINQDIDCSAGCKVSERAVYTKKLWKGVK